MVDHSATPWTHDATLSFGERVLLAGDDEIGFLYVSDGADEPTAYPAFANAAFIVKAVNSHDALVKALERIAGNEFLCPTAADFAKAVLGDVGGVRHD